MRLVEATAEYRDAFLDMACDFVQACNVRGERYAHALADFDGFLARLKRGRDASQLPLGRVPGVEFWLIAEAGLIIGTGRLRLSLTPQLEREAGHIGYDIRPSQRRRGHGTLLLKLLLEQAKNYGLSRVLLTCDTTNLASARIIEKNGGVYVGQVTSEESGELISRYWIELVNLHQGHAGT